MTWFFFAVLAIAVILILKLIFKKDGEELFEYACFAILYLYIIYVIFQ